MNRYRTFAAAMIVAALGLGASVAPANAAIVSHPQDRAVQAHQHRVSPKAVRKVVHDIATAKRQLEHAATYAPSQTSGDHLGILMDHLAADRAGLSALTVKARAAKTAKNLRKVRASLRQVHPINYVLAANHLGNSRRMTTYIADLTAKVEPGSAQADQLAAAQAQIPVIIAQALTITARTPQAYLDAIQATSDGVSATIDAVRYYLGTTPTAP
jgi:hypothetical protein